MAAVPLDDMPSNLVPMDDLPDHLAPSSRFDNEVPSPMGQQPVRQAMPTPPLQGVDNIPVARQFAGAGETALSMATALPSMAVGGVKGVVQSIIDRSIATSHDTAQQTASDFVNKYSYHPRTQAGQEMLADASDVINNSGLAGLAPLSDMSSLARLGKVPTVNSKQTALDLLKSQNLTKDTTAADSNAAGYVMPPSAIGGGMGSRALEGLSGKVKVQQLAITKNQPVTNKLARADLGLPDSVSLNESVLAKDRFDKSQPYRDIEQLPETVVGQKTERSQGTGNMVVTDIVKNGKQLIDDLNETRAASRRYWQATHTGQHPEAYDKAVALDAHAEALEGQIAKIAESSGNSQLVEQLKQARRALAKNHMYDNALNDSTGNIDAVILGKAKDRGAPLTGNALTIAKFANGFRDVARMPKTGDANPTTAVDAGLGMLIGAGHLASGGIPLAAVGVPLAARTASRYGLLSQFMQKGLTNPSYTASPSAAELAGISFNNAVDSTPYLTGALTGNSQ